MANADYIVIMGRNMAECHPVGFQGDGGSWARRHPHPCGPTLHAHQSHGRDVHVPIRPNSDIAFLDGLVHYILENERYFHDYVVHYTNAPAILREDFQDTEEFDGRFSG
ncbi:molybdopterin-dependent oxidoreductase [Archangium violaceum]|nr:molybdopterin-dependent oxidoreductase [Archangium violaceum]